jgi:hypothetical protein
MRYKLSSLTYKVVLGGKEIKAMLPIEGNCCQEAILTVVEVLIDFELPPVKKSEWVLYTCRWKPTANSANTFFICISASRE